MAVFLEEAVGELNHVARQLFPKLKKLGIETVNDLIFYYPQRYDDLSKIVKINSLEPGLVATIRGRVQLIKSQRSWKRRVLITEAIISDETGSVKIVWFGQAYISKILKAGDEVYIAGKTDFKKGIIFSSPSYEKITSNKLTGGTIHTGRLVPVYNLTKGVTSKQLRFLIKGVLDQLKSVSDFLPEQIKKEMSLPELWDSVLQIHFPDDQKKLDKASRRLKFDELFLIQLKNQLSRLELEKSQASPLEFKEDVIKSFVASLPFKLTDAQRQAAWEILKDLEKTRPMNRLLEGDVGSGKTVVALLGILNTIKNGYQAALMAPTEILASQHYKTLNNFFGDADFNIGILTRSKIEVNGQKIDKKEFIRKIKRGTLQILVGTHSLIQDKIEFKHLALAVIDEQHRFGVAQRKILREKSGDKNILPHLLSMTATPIPRTLALTLYGDLDLSIISEMPKGRKKIITKVVEKEKRLAAYDFIKKEVALGAQIFVICPLIDFSDKLGVKSVKEEYERLKTEVFPDLKIGMLHGRLKAEEKEKTMNDFIACKIDILVATSVIEVGIDIPNASIMMIEGAERFGLAQLHQFRGRVGRGERQSYCFLMSESENEGAFERLSALVESNNGFELAEKDLHFRGPGEVFGLEQSGLPDLKLANLFDYELVKQARDWAANLIKVDPEMAGYPQLKEKTGEVERVHFE